MQGLVTLTRIKSGIISHFLTWVGCALYEEITRNQMHIQYSILKFPKQYTPTYLPPVA